MLTPREITATAETITALQLPNGMIQWFENGHADPWNHVEAAMALAVAGFRAEAERAYDWLQGIQHDDGSWCSYYLAGDKIEDPRRDTNVTAYIATGAWHHYLVTKDIGFLEVLWPTIEAAIGFALSLQTPSGELLWSLEPDRNFAPADYGLLTGSSSAYFSIRCAIAIAETLGSERPDWELAVGRLGYAVAHRPEGFADKHVWAMDWYYPVLSGALTGDAARARIDERWREFLMPGKGIRCVSDRPWVTAAETAECVMALDACGRTDDAVRLLRWAQHLRDDDGSYWTGCVYPEVIHFPDGERSTYTSAAVLLADHALDGAGAAAGLFRGDDLPRGVEIDPDLDLA